ncbi:MAG: heme lyase CcmF/NrfE family subunit [Calditrichaceae bacterium]
MPGTVLIITGVLATIVSIYQYFLVTKEESIPLKKRKNTDAHLRIARLSYYIMTFAVSLASVYLFYLIFSHQFQFKYVYSYTSRDLPTGFLFSAFWAGQEGSFLLWALLIALMGAAFIKTANHLEARSMLVVNLIQGFFLVILVKASPFAVMAQTPPDGAGLNPLLQNFWMVIHPPVLFVGYAAASFPLALGLAALMKKEYDGWVKLALPWAAFTSLTLGAGIILGAFWAYETLGWGGYWGWDPVENSSLIPWLTTLALIHSLIVQKMKGSLKKTNFVLVIITFILVIYATFLTRSGVLSDFSVHSFANLGINNYLIVFMLTFLLLGFGIFLMRRNDIPFVAIDKAFANRENGLFVSIYVFLAFAFLTFIGTSSPIITGFLSTPSQVNISFYNQVNLPVAIIMALLLGIIPWLTWIEHNNTDIIRRSLPSLVFAMVAGITAYVFGINKPLMLIFIVTAAFTTWTNIFVIFKQWKKGWQNTGAPVSHFGIGIMMIGIVVSGSLDKTDRLFLTQNQPTNVLGYELTYLGISEKEDGKSVVNIKVRNESEEYTAQPRLYFSPKNNGMMREPDVRPGFIEDLYISPLERQISAAASADHSMIIKKGESKIAGNYKIEFVEYDMNSHSESGNMNIGAVLNISNGSSAIKAVPVMEMSAQGRRPIPAAVHLESDGGEPAHATVSLIGINASNKTVELSIKGFPGMSHASVAPAEKLVIEISIKPFMTILWIGTIIMMTGGLISVLKRSKAAGSTD